MRISFPSYPGVAGGDITLQCNLLDRDNTRARPGCSDKWLNIQDVLTQQGAGLSTVIADGHESLFC